MKEAVSVSFLVENRCGDIVVNNLKCDVKDR